MAENGSSGVPAEGYLDWAQEELGVIVHQPLRVSSTPGKEERGVFCEENIPAESIIVSVPWEALMTIDNAVGTPFEGLMEAGGREDDVLCLLLLYHRHILKERSPLKRHVDALPREYHQTIFYSDDEVELLRGTSLHALTLQWRAQADADFRELGEVQLSSPATDAEGSSTVSDALEGFLTKEGYLWALGTVWSRFITVQRGGRALKAMAPVFDMFNHNPRSSTVHGFQESNQCLHLVTLQEWPAGSEVKFSYGLLSNSRLLLLHGFCLPDNPYESVELWAMMEPGAPNYDAKTKMLERNGVRSSERPFLLTCKGLDQALIPALRVQRATNSELELAENTPWGESLGARNEAAVIDDLSSALAAMLKEREGPSSAHASCNGPSTASEAIVTSTAAGTGAHDDAAGEQEEKAEAEDGEVLPEDRRRAVMLMRQGEQRVLRLCAEWVEEYRLTTEQQLE